MYAKHGFLCKGIVGLVIGNPNTKICRIKSAINNKKYYIQLPRNINNPGAPLTYFNNGGGGSLSDFFGSEIWPKVIFWGL